MSASLSAAFAAVDALVPADAPEDRQLIATKTKALMVGYEARWGGSEWRPVMLEQTVVLPVVNPETGRVSRTWRQAGKFDGVVEGYEKSCLFEAKTTSEDIADPSSTYWRRLAIDSQVSMYFLQSWQGGHKLDGALYDVTRKPGIRPRRLTKQEVGEITMFRTYCGSAVSDDAHGAVVSGRLDEGHELFGLRLAAECVAEPERYFQRRMIPRLDGELIEYATELWQIADEIRLAQNSDRHFRNSNACLEYGTPCAYLGICSGSDSVESDHWIKLPNVHVELDGLEGDGRDLLTNSRIKTYMTCRRKHFFKYGLGIVKADSLDTEAIYMGTLWHEALAAWWGAHGQ